RTQKDTDQVVGWLDERYYWADVLGELRQALIRVEDSTRQRLRTDAGVWVEKFTSLAPREGELTAADAAAGVPAPVPMVNTEQNEAFRRRYGLGPVGAPPAPPPSPEGTPADGAPKKPADTNEISSITITFRAVSLTQVSGQPEANKETAYAVLAE